jgi:hypothetical protein
MPNTQRRRILVSLGLLAAFAFSAYAKNEGRQGAVTANAVENSSQPDKVLFVGNSITYFNDLPAHFAALASRAAGKPVQAEMIVGAGARIDEHAAGGVVKKQLETGAYSTVVLQEFGRGLACDAELARIGFDCTASHAAHRALVDAARANGVRVVLLGTYSNHPQDARQLSSAEKTLARQLRVDHVGLDDLPDLRERMPTLAWFHTDGMHPGPDLTLLMASRLSERLYGKQPVTTPLEIKYRDYAGKAPKPTSLASSQSSAAPLRTRVVASDDLKFRPGAGR